MTAFRTKTWARCDVAAPLRGTRTLTNLARRHGSAEQRFALLCVLGTEAV
jgi:hypothetical protein